MNAHVLADGAVHGRERRRGRERREQIQPLRRREQFDRDDVRRQVDDAARP